MNDKLRNVQLLTGDRTTTVDAFIETDLPANVLAELENQWGELRRAGNLRLEREGNSEQCEHGHWAWDREHKMIGVTEKRFRLYGVRIGAEWQGAMSVYREPVNAHLWPRWKQWLKFLGFGRPQALHVDYVETAPWNYERFVHPNFPRYRRTGGILMVAAVRLSVEMGLQGRVGLYSLAGSERFYKGLGMTRLFEDRDPRSSTRGCWYYELSVKAAQSLLTRRTTGG